LSPNKKKSKKKKAKIQVRKAEIEKYASKAWTFLKEHGDKIPELAMYSGVAYMGARAFEDWKGAIAGMVGLKLATTPSSGEGISIYSPLFGVDIPFNSQTVGIAILAAIGVAGIALPAIRTQAATVARETTTAGFLTGLQYKLSGILK